MYEQIPPYNLQNLMGLSAIRQQAGALNGGASSINSLLQAPRRMVIQGGAARTFGRASPMQNRLLWPMLGQRRPGGVSQQQGLPQQQPIQKSFGNPGAWW